MYNFVDRSHKRQPPISDHFVMPQGWLLMRELTVLCMYCMFLTYVIAYIEDITWPCGDKEFPFKC